MGPLSLEALRRSRSEAPAWRTLCLSVTSSDAPQATKSRQNGQNVQKFVIFSGTGGAGLIGALQQPPVRQLVTLARFVLNLHERGVQRHDLAPQ